MALARPMPVRTPRRPSAQQMAAMAASSANPAEREHALRAAGVEPNPLVPLAAAWAAPRGWKDGVYKQGAVLLAGDMFLEALNGDAIARCQLKERQEFRRNQRLKQMAMQKQMSKMDVQWQADKGMPGTQMETQQALVLRRTPELTSEKVGKVPQGAMVYVLEMLRPNEDGIRRALVQDAMGKNSGWLTALDVGGEANLKPVRPKGRMVEEEYDEDDRGAWLQHEVQKELWDNHQFPKFDHIRGQQEKSQPKNLQLKQIQRRQRQDKATGAAGKRSTIDPRAGGAGGAFRAARAMGAR